MVREAVILAGGESKRMKRGMTDPVLINTPKPLLEINGKSIIARKIEKLLEADFSVNIIISEKDKPIFEERLKDYPVTYSVQGQEKGTAAALYAAKDWVKDDLFLVEMGDDLYNFDVKSLRDYKTPVVFGFEVDDVSSYGLLITNDDGDVTDILEKQGSGRGLANTGMYVMHKDFFDVYNDIPSDEKSGERFLTHAVKILRGRNINFKVKKIDFWFGVNTPEQLRQADLLINGGKNERYG
jgi:bifunctional UDP-N-acetylglucosamine pyrophosphorylase/glucosamine-1-phosphate N-acetyltransferase